jgi:hypothetical protein
MPNTIGYGPATFYDGGEIVDAFASYISAEWNLSGAEAAPDFDFDGDGLPNAIEFVLGGNPTASDTQIAPTAALEDTDMVFTFRRSAESASYNPVVEYGSDLESWTEAGDGVAGVEIDVVANGFGSGVDSVAVTIPQAATSDGRCFARLKVEIPDAR